MERVIKKRLRFKEEDDMTLLRQVLGLNPFQNPDLWMEIQENVFILTGKQFSIKTLKDHLDLLLKLFLEKNKIYKDKSGIEEEYSEKDQLCQNIYDYMETFRIKNKITTKNTKNKKNENLGKISRDKWAKTHALEGTSPVSIALQMPGDHTYCDIYINEEEIMDSADVLATPCAGNTLPDIYYINEEIMDSAGGTSTKENNFNTLPEITDPKMDDIENLQTIDQKACSSVVQPQSNLRRSKVLRPVKGRKRKLNVQRQGLEYLQNYDAEQKLSKIKDIELEDRKIKIEERRITLDEKRFEAEQKERNAEREERNAEREERNIRL